MEVIICPTAQDVAVLVADVFTRVVRAHAHPVLGLATGDSPRPTYDELIQRCDRGELSFADARCFLLDEYVGLPADHPEAYRAFIQRVFTDHIDLPPDRLYGPDGSRANLESAGPDYERQIADAGGIDLQLLGIGSDGHIGFNEPMSSLGSRTRLKTLTGTTRSDNARFFGGDPDAVPRHVLTQGIGTILDARQLVLVATGSGKAAAVAAAVEGPLTSMVPASAIQLHPHAAVVVDEGAAEQLAYAAYYREAYENKPDWQHI